MTSSPTGDRRPGDRPDAPARREPLPFATRAALVVAAVAGVALVVAGFTLPAYRTDEAGSGSGATEATGTMVEINGPGIVAALVLPLVVVAAVWLVLRLGRSWSRPAAWGLTGALALYNVATLTSIGILVLPVTLALVVACATVGRTARPEDVVL